MHMCAHVHVHVHAHVHVHVHVRHVRCSDWMRSPIVSSLLNKQKTAPGEKLSSLSSVPRVDEPAANTVPALVHYTPTFPCVSPLGCNDDSLQQPEILSTSLCMRFWCFRRLACRCPSIRMDRSAMWLSSVGGRAASRLHWRSQRRAATEARLWRCSRATHSAQRAPVSGCPLPGGRHSRASTRKPRSVSVRPVRSLDPTFKPVAEFQSYGRVQSYPWTL